MQIPIVNLQAVISTALQHLSTEAPEKQICIEDVQYCLEIGPQDHGLRSSFLCHLQQRK